MTRGAKMPVANSDFRYLFAYYTVRGRSGCASVGLGSEVQEVRLHRHLPCH